MFMKKHVTQMSADHVFLIISDNSGALLLLLLLISDFGLLVESIHRDLLTIIKTHTH